MLKIETEAAEKRKRKMEKKLAKSTSKDDKGRFTKIWIMNVKLKISKVEEEKGVSQLGNEHYYF